MLIKGIIKDGRKGKILSMGMKLLRLWKRFKNNDKHEDLTQSR